MVNGHPSSSQAQPAGDVTFVEVASERGIARTGVSWGVAWGDFNGDGFIDLYTNNHNTDFPSLYRNNGGQSFSDVAYEAGLINRDLHGAAWADYDEDGDLDLYQNVGYNSPNIFYRNDGVETLTNVASEAGVEDSGRGRDVAWADYDHDGDLDFFITNQSGTSKLFRNQGDGTFIDRTHATGLNGISGESHLWGDYNNDGWLDLLIWQSSVRLFRNNGDGSFTDKSTVLNGVTQSHIVDIDWADYDNDGDLDLYVSRGYQHPGITWNADRLKWHTWAGSGERGFDWHLSPSSAAVTFDIYRFCSHADRDKISIGASGAHPSSIPFTLGNGQGPDPRGKPPYTPGVDTGIFIWLDWSGEWHLRSTGEIDNGRLTSSGDFSAVTPYDLVVDPSPVLARNELWENRGAESFADVTDQVNVGDTSQSWAALWGDFDNDSDLDLYVSNHGPFLDNEPNTYYVNNGDKTFTEDAASADLRAVVGGRGDIAAAADYDRDGFLDILLTNGASAPGPCGGPDLLFENQGNGNHWLQIQTIGTISNRDGIGAYLALEANGITQYRQQLAGKHANAQDSSLIHFGLGNATTVENLTITWPSGISEVYTDLIVDRLVTLTEGAALPGLLSYPYLGTTTPTSVAISWATDSPGASEVRYSRDQSHNNVVTATSDVYDGKYWHSATLTGLFPGTSYYYKVYTGGYDLTPWSEITFTTAPAAAASQFTFVAFGDSRPSGVNLPPNPAALEVAAAMDQHSFDLAIHTGDMVYQGGVCTGVDSSWNQYMRAYFDVYREMVGDIPFYPSIGNHELGDGSCGYQAFSEIFQLPANAQSGDTEEYYSFDWGNAHFVALDTNQNYTVGSSQYNWLVSDLATSTLPWKFVFFHHPPYGTGRHGSNLTVRTHLAPVFEDYGVDAVFNGHNQLYERTCPILDNTCTTPQAGGVLYLTTGGGGAGLNDLGDDWFVAYNARVYHFLKVQVNDCRWRMDAVDHDGVVFDTYQLDYCDVLTAPQIISTPVTDAFVSEPYTYDVETTGNPPPTYTLTVAPPAMNIDEATGEISWTPNTTGTFGVAVEAVNSEGVDTQAFTITVQAVYTIAVNTVGHGLVAVNPDRDTYHYGDMVTFTATPDPGWSFAGWSGDFVGEDNPTELTLNSSTVVTATFTNSAPALDPIGNKVITSGLTLSFTVNASDLDGITPSLTAVNLPVGASFLDNRDGTGSFGWRPGTADVGRHTVTFIASDGLLTASETITITVNRGAHQLFLPLVVAGQTASLAATFTQRVRVDIAPQSAFCPWLTHWAGTPPGLPLLVCAPPLPTPPASPGAAGNNGH